MMKNRFIQLTNPNRCLLLGLTAIGICISSVQAEDSNVRDSAAKVEGWQFELTPYVWALGLDGELGVGPINTGVDIGFDELVKDLKGGLMLELDIRRDRVGFRVEGLLAAVEADGNIGPLPTSLKLDQAFARFDVNYRLGPFPLGKNSKATVVVDPFIGGRYSYMDTTVNVGSLPPAEKSLYWLDPMVGLRSFWTLGDHWNFIVSGNVGGFDVNARLAWEAIGAVGYQFYWTKHHKATGNVLLGYRALYQDYETGSGLERFEFDATMKGPFIGLTIGF